VRCDINSYGWLVECGCVDSKWGEESGKGETLYILCSSVCQSFLKQNMFDMGLCW